jgi:hypothetical protein
VNRIDLLINGTGKRIYHPKLDLLEGEQKKV